MDAFVWASQWPAMYPAMSLGNACTDHIFLTNNNFVKVIFFCLNLLLYCILFVQDFHTCEFMICIMNFITDALTVSIVVKLYNQNVHNMVNSTNYGDTHFEVLLSHYFLCHNSRYSQHPPCSQTCYFSCVRDIHYCL
jgi:hypothetical protein